MNDVVLILILIFQAVQGESQHRTLIMLSEALRSAAFIYCFEKHCMYEKHVTHICTCFNQTEPLCLSHNSLDQHGVIRDHLPWAFRLTALLGIFLRVCLSQAGRRRCTVTLGLAGARFEMRHDHYLDVLVDLFLRLDGGGQLRLVTAEPTLQRMLSAGEGALPGRWLRTQEVGSRGPWDVMRRLSLFVFRF